MTDCIFCKIAKKEIPSSIVYEDDKTVAFEDINPQAPIHIVIIPKIHIEKLSNLNSPQEYNLISNIFEAINQIAKNKNLPDLGFRIVVNCGSDAGQAVLHLHFHLLGGRKLHWPPG